MTRIGVLMSGHPVLAVVLVLAATAAVVAGNAVRAEAEEVRSAAEASRADLTAHAEVIEVARRFGQPVAIVRYEPPEGTTSAAAMDGTPLPNVRPAHLGDQVVAPGDTLTVRLSPLHDTPTVDVGSALAVAARLRTIAGVAQGFAVAAYLVALILLIGLFRQRDVPTIRAETASRHGGA